MTPLQATGGESQRMMQGARQTGLTGPEEAHVITMTGKTGECVISE